MTPRNERETLTIDRSKAAAAEFGRPEIAVGSTTSARRTRTLRASSFAALDPAVDVDAGPFWRALDEELAHWREAGACATFWWRDDDATAASLSLDRLLDMSVNGGAPVAIAAIPEPLCKSLSDTLANRHTVQVLQHGFSHRNHAAGLNEGAWELGLHRDVGVIIDELTAGREILRAAFGAQFIPIMVPPWNRIDRHLLPHLQEGGFIGVSAFGQRSMRFPIAGFAEANTHFDLLAWKGAPRFRGQAAAQRDIVGHLRNRRLGMAQPDEATGVLSHHLTLDGEAWRFLDDFVRYVARHTSARWLSASEVFEISGQP